jgi:hypothetical protein
MEDVLQHYIDKVLPYRLYAMGAFEMALHLVANYPKGASLVCKFDSQVRIQGSSTIITNPTIEMGIIHSRVLLEFLGIKAKSDTQLLSRLSSRKTDITIESFGLAKVTIENALLPCNGDKTVAEEAMAKTLTAANKLVAHSTELVKIDNDSIANHLVTCKAIPVLFNLYFYKKLGLTMPETEVTKHVKNS